MKVSTNKLLCLAILISGVWALSAQGPSNCGEDRSNLVVGSNFSGEFGHPPFEVPDTAIQPTVLDGYDIAVACEIASRLGFENVTFRQTPFAELLDAVAAGDNIDIGMSAISITQDRLDREDLAFVKYNEDDLGIVMTQEFADTDAGLRDAATVLQTLQDIAAGNNDIGVAVVTGTRQMEIINGPDYPNLLAVEVANVTDGLAQVVDDNDTQALFTDGVTAIFLSVNNVTFFGLENVFVEQDSDVPTMGLGIALSGDEECCQFYANVNQAIKDMVADGSLDFLGDEFGLTLGFNFEDFTPNDCVGTDPNINSNIIFNYIFTKDCGICSPTVTNVG